VELPVRSRARRGALERGALRSDGGHLDRHRIDEQPSHEPYCTLLPSGKVLVAGGSTGTATTASAEMYDPSSGTWTLVAPMATPRQSQGRWPLERHGAIVGGLNDASSAVIGVGTLEVYDPTRTLGRPRAMVTTRQSFVLNASAMDAFS